MSSVRENQHAEGGASGLPGASPYEKSSSSAAFDAPIDPKAERKLVMKLDLTILPVFFTIYMMAFLDRINISNAAIQGMTQELHLDEGSRFNVALFVCFLRSLISPHAAYVLHSETPRTS
jgi:hypothetical protein